MAMEIFVSVILLFAGIGAVIIIHICIVGRTFRRGYDNGIMVERGSFGSTSMSKEEIEKLPWFDFKARSKGTSPVDCAVCLENFKSGEKCRLLPLCNHSFHARCVDSWLLRASVCPICRSSADSFREGMMSAEASSRISEIAIELRENQRTESGYFNDTVIQVRDGQAAESNRPTDSAIALTASPTVESTHPNVNEIQLSTTNAATH